MFRPTSGFFDGTVTDFGDYDQCVNIVGPSTSRDTNTPAFHGHYCLMIVRPKMPNMPRKISWKTELFNFTGTELEGTVSDELDLLIKSEFEFLIFVTDTGRAEQVNLWHLSSPRPAWCLCAVFLYGARHGRDLNADKCGNQSVG